MSAHASVAVQTQRERSLHHALIVICMTNLSAVYPVLKRKQALLMKGIAL